MKRATTRSLGCCGSTRQARDEITFVIPHAETHAMSCCRFRGHEDKIVTKELECRYDETEVQP